MVHSNVSSPVSSGSDVSFSFPGSGWDGGWVWIPSIWCFQVSEARPIFAEEVCCNLPRKKRFLYFRKRSTWCL
jgi:hypothetical protein